ncbi:hypothetical protein ACZ87_04018 [Candidatus Erwinia dacicola]|uniref:Uncharacterized protein n=1 Tax=Candidatus Erwinia dacicola TaxID=252393 RepID=A0A328T831_9GAMM|nr:hypothetical protein ACZ87_04018 [Candidatus Erwinia dacicola]
MLLGKIELLLAEGFGLQAGIDIALKRKNRLAFSTASLSLIYISGHCCKDLAMVN